MNTIWERVYTAPELLAAVVGAGVVVLLMLVERLSMRYCADAAPNGLVVRAS